ncbi:MAG: HAD-IA family hydrolase [Phycisphaerae bacterium]
MNFAPFKLLTFDCYGTLVDWETGLLGALRAWARQAGRAADDEALLACFGAIEPIVQAERPGEPYRLILREVQRRMAGALGAPAREADAAALADSVGDWPVFADTPAALRLLQSRYRLMVVSNVDRLSFDRTRPKLGVELDGLVTAEEVGAYKPDRRMFRRAIQVAASLGAAPGEILHVAQSLFHDVAPASALGLATVWVDRRAGQAGGATRAAAPDVRADLVVRSLEELSRLAVPGG